MRRVLLHHIGRPGALNNSPVMSALHMSRSNIDGGMGALPTISAIPSRLAKLLVAGVLLLVACFLLCQCLLLAALLMAALLVLVAVLVLVGFVSVWWWLLLVSRAARSAYTRISAGGGGTPPQSPLVSSQVLPLLWWLEVNSFSKASAKPGSSPPT